MGGKRVGKDAGANGATERMYRIRFTRISVMKNYEGKETKTSESSTIIKTITDMC